MRQAIVYFRDQRAGVLSEDAEGYLFVYDPDYVASPQAHAISLTLPMTLIPFRSSVMFPFFDGLIPEGWLLDIAVSNWKIDRRDRMALLLACCKDCIGAVSLRPLVGKEDV